MGRGKLGEEIRVLFDTVGVGFLQDAVMPLLDRRVQSSCLKFLRDLFSSLSFLLLPVSMHPH